MDSRLINGLLVLMAIGAAIGSTYVSAEHAAYAQSAASFLFGLVLRRPGDQPGSTHPDDTRVGR
jgi:hypothetical protein